MRRSAADFQVVGDSILKQPLPKQSRVKESSVISSAAASTVLHPERRYGLGYGFVWIGLLDESLCRPVERIAKNVGCVCRRRVF